MNFLSWNCRGVGGPRAVRSLSDVVKTHRPSLLGLIETKKEDADWNWLKYKLGFSGCFTVGSNGRSRGLALLWSDEVDVLLCSFSDFHIDVLIRGKEEFCLTLFYGRPRVQERVDSWNLLRRLKRDNTKAWLVMGDFNEISFSWEMESKQARQRWQMSNFRCCLEECELTDLGFRGNMFTYSNRRKGNDEVKARLDRAVANAAWRCLFPNALVRHGFANSSDHVPMVVQVKGGRTAGRQHLQKFEPMWLRHSRFKEVVRESWEGQGDVREIADKLRACMEKLTHWNGSEFGSVKGKVKELKLKIQELRNGSRTEDTADQEARLSGELDEWMEREELYWRQRSRAEWLKYGDRNTSFFHAKATRRRRRNFIDRLKDQRGCSVTRKVGLPLL
ncbi:unnamed protein product [Rhodiola kirilowii]